MVSPNGGDLIELGISVKAEGDGAKTIRNLKKEYATLEGAIKRANRATDDEAKAVSGIEKELAKLERRKALEELARDAANAGTQTDILVRALRDIGATESEVRSVQKAYDKLSESIEKANNASQGGFEVADEFNTQVRNRAGGLGDLGTAGNTIAGAAQAAGFQKTGGAIQAAAGVAELAEGVVQLGGAATTTIAALGLGTTALLALAPAIAAIGAVVAIVATQIQNFRESVKTGTDRLKEFNLDLRTLGTDEASAKLKDIEDQLGATTDTLDQLRAGGENVDGALGAVVKQFGGYNEAVKELETEQDNLIRQVDLYRNALDDSAFAANDAANALELTADELERINEEARRFNDSLIESARQTQLFIDTASSSDQIEAQIEALEAQKRSYEESIQVFGISGEKQDEYARQLETINTQLEILNATGQERIQTLKAEEAATEAVNKFIEGLEEGARQAEKASEAVAKAAEKRANEQQRLAETAANAIIKAEDDIKRIREQSAQQITRIESQLAQRLEGLARDRTEGLADAERDASDARADAKREADGQLLELEEDLGKRRRQIERQTTLSLEQAAGERNAVAAVEARERREQELSDLSDEETERRTEINRQLQATTDDINRNLQRQRETINRQYQRQLDEAQRSAQAQIDLERQKAQAEIQLRQQQIQAELQALSTLDSAAQQFANNMVSLARQLGSVRSSIALQTSRSSSSGSTRSSSSSRGSTSSSSSSGGGLLTRIGSGIGGLLSRIPSADSGAVIQRPGLLRVTSGERVLRPNQSDPMTRQPMTFNMGGININGTGMTRTQIRQEAIQVFDKRLGETLDLAGIEE